MAPEGSPFYIIKKSGRSGCAVVKGSDWLLLRERAGGKSWGMNVSYVARHWII